MLERGLQVLPLEAVGDLAGARKSIQGRLGDALEGSCDDRPADEDGDADDHDQRSEEFQRHRSLSGSPGPRPDHDRPEDEAADTEEADHHADQAEADGEAEGLAPRPPGTP